MKRAWSVKTSSWTQIFIELCYYSLRTDLFAIVLFKYAVSIAGWCKMSPLFCYKDGKFVGDVKQQ